VEGRVVSGRALALVAVLLLVMLAAGCSNNPHTAATPVATSQRPTAAPSASPPQPGAATTKQFDSPAMGVAFSYPADWRLQLDPADDPTQRSLEVKGIGLLSLHVHFERASASDRPQPFTAATETDLALWSRSLTGAWSGAHILRRSLIDLDGLRMAAIQFSAPGPLGARSLRSLAYTSSQSPGAHASAVYFNLGCLDMRWRAERPVLLRIIASMRFSRPRG